MAEERHSPHAARSRAPLDEIGVKWWEQFGSNDSPSSQKVHSQHTEPKFKDKSTSTINLTLHKEVTFKLNKSKDPKDTVLKKWKEEQARMKYEKARKALINSLKVKFRGPNHTNIGRAADENRVGISEVVTSIEMIEDNVEGSSNSNVNHKDGTQSMVDRSAGKDRVEIDEGAVEDVSHARKVWMEAGGELAQWRFGSRGSRAAGAEGGLRGLFTGDMPLSRRLYRRRPRSKSTYQSLGLDKYRLIQ